MFIGKLTKSHTKSWKENNTKNNINEFYGKSQIKTLGQVFDDREQTKQEVLNANSATNYIRNDSLSESGEESYVDTVAQVHKTDTDSGKTRKSAKTKSTKKNTEKEVQMMNEKNANVNNDDTEKEEKPKRRDFSKVKQKLRLTKIFGPQQNNELQHHESQDEILNDIDAEKAERTIPTCIVTNEKCKLPDKDSSFSHVNEIREDIPIEKTSRPKPFAPNYENKNRIAKSYTSANKEEQSKFTSTGIQATPFPPFRLHFLPEENWRETDDKIQKALKIILSQCGLACIVITWAMLGALMFRLTEGPQEKYQVIELNRQQSSLVIGLATDLRQVVPQEPVWRQTIERYAARHEALILSAVSSGYPQRGTIWTYPGSILFSTSLLTTLGFGAPVPRTVVGRMCAIFFAGLGIPVHLLLVLNIGLLIAVKLTRLANILQRKFKLVKLKIHRVQTRGEEERESWPEELFVSDKIAPPHWLKFFPFFAIPTYYLTGFLLFGVARGKQFPEIFLFPLDFTSAGGVASTDGSVRIAYAMYLEGAVILASTNVALLRVSATRGFTTAAIKLGLMTNSAC